MSKTAVIVEEEEIELEAEERPKTVAPKKKKVAPKRPAEEDKEKEEEAAPKKKVVAPKKPKKVATPAAAALVPVEPEPVEDEPVPVEAAEPKKPRKHHEPRAKGDRYSRPENYRAKLMKDRAARAVGKDPSATRVRHRPGVLINHEIKALKKSNGLHVTYAYTNRLARLIGAKRVAACRREEAASQKRLESRGKNVPASLKLDDSLNFGAGPTILCQAYLNDELGQFAQAAGKITSHGGRKTVNTKDAIFAFEEMFGFAPAIAQ